MLKQVRTDNSKYKREGIEEIGQDLLYWFDLQCGVYIQSPPKVRFSLTKYSFTTTSLSSQITQPQEPLASPTTIRTMAFARHSITLSYSLVSALAFSLNTKHTLVFISECKKNDKRVPLDYKLKSQGKALEGR